MRITRIDSVYPYLKGSKFIGFGRTAICFFMKNGKVIKLFIETYNKKDLFAYVKNPIEHFSKISEIKNDTYIAPDELLVKDGEVVGYLYDYVYGKTLKSYNYKLQPLINSYDKLMDDTYKISEQGFDLFDVHDKNILFDKNFRIIDLDQGEFSELDSNKLFLSNMKDINKTIIYNLFNVSIKDELFFRDYDENKLYNDALYNNVYEMKELLNDLKKLGDKRNKLVFKKNRIIDIHKNYHCKY